MEQSTCPPTSWIADPRGCLAVNASALPSRALAANPDVLLCDEITAALDEDTGQRVLQMLRARQHHSDLTIIWATHDQSLADSFADTILDMDPERPQPVARAS